MIACEHTVCGDGEQRCYLLSEWAQLGQFLPTSVKKRDPENNMLISWHYIKLLPPTWYAIVHGVRASPGVYRVVAELLGPCVGALCRGASHRARVCCRDREPLLSSWSHGWSVCRTVQVVLAPGSALFLVRLFSYDATDQPCELACNACLARPGLVTVLRACCARSMEKPTRGALCASVNINGPERCII